MIKIIDYGMGNLYSITNAFRKIGACVEVTCDPAGLDDADGIVIPGVGAFDEAMKNLAPFKPKIMEAVEGGVPLMGICLGMQALYESSEEGALPGLGIIPGRVVRLQGDVVVPQMGWNELEIERESRMLDGINDGDFFYFVHSYHCVAEDPKITIASTDYGGRIAAAVSAGNVFAVQFHPEKSGGKGLLILENFLGGARC